MISTDRGVIRSALVGSLNVGNVSLGAWLLVVLRVELLRVSWAVRTGSANLAGHLGDSAEGAAQHLIEPDAP
jgi:hypothetical protein